MVGVHDLYTGRFGNHAGGHGSRALCGKTQALRLIIIDADSHALEVQNKISHVLANTRDRREFMDNALNLYGRNGGTLKRRQQNTAEGVADGHAKATLEWSNLDHRLARVVFGLPDFQFVGLFQVQPVLFNHIGVPLCEQYPVSATPAPQAGVRRAGQSRV